MSQTGHFGRKQKLRSNFECLGHCGHISKNKNPLLKLHKNEHFSPILQEPANVTKISWQIVTYIAYSDNIE